MLPLQEKIFHVSLCGSLFTRRGTVEWCMLFGRAKNLNYRGQTEAQKMLKIRLEEDIPLLSTPPVPPSPLPPLGTREKTRKQFVNAGGVELLLCFLFHRELRCQGRVREEYKNYRLSYSSSTKQPFVWHLDSKATPPHDSTVRHLAYLFSHSRERQGDPRDEGRSVLS